MNEIKWVAIYKDGTKIKDTEMSTADLDRTKLAEFEIWRNDHMIFKTFFSDKRKLIFRKRTFLTGAGRTKEVVYLVGWHENVKGVSVKSICYIYEDHIEFDDDRHDLELIPCEC